MINVKVSISKKIMELLLSSVCKLRNLIPNNHFAARGWTLYEIVSGETPDISEYAAFHWYQPVWYINSSSYPNDNKLIGRWLGVSHRVGQAMCFWILNENGGVLSRSSVQAISKHELETVGITNALKQFDLSIENLLNVNNVSANIQPPIDMNPLYVIDIDEDDAPSSSIEDDDNISPLLYDKLLTAEVVLAHDHTWKLGKVTGYKRDHEGRFLGNVNPNPLLNTRMYQVTLSDGSTQDYAANMIAKAIYNEHDDEINQYQP